MSDNLAALKTCQAENDRLRKLLQDARAFKQWSFKTMKDANIAFVKPETQEDYTSTELSADPNSCMCPFCGQIDDRKESTCDWQKCSSCGHGMRKNNFSLPRLQGK
jgi:hypothetical protein